MIAALSGTMTERNTIISSRNDMASTAPMKMGSRLAIFSEMSMKKAVCPVTRVRSTPVAWRAWGRTSWRRRCTSTSVRRFWGELLGKTVTRPIDPSGETVGCGDQPLTGGGAEVARGAVVGDEREADRRLLR